MQRIKSIENVVFEYGSLFIQENFSPKSKIVETYIAADSSRIYYSSNLINPSLTLDSREYSWVTDEQRIAILAMYEADSEVDILFTDNSTSTAKFALENPPTFQEIGEGMCIYGAIIPMYYTSQPIPPPPPFLLKVHSSTAPLVTAVGGTLITTNNGDGTWNVSGATGITEVSFDFDTDLWETLNPNVTKVECLNADSLTSLGKFCWGMNITEITFGAGFDTSKVTKIGSYDEDSGIFAECTNLTSVPLFDTSSVTDMYSAFYRCENLTSVPLFDTSSVTRLTYAFHYCTSLTSIPLFDTSSCTDFKQAFGMCTNLTSVPLFNTSSVTTFASAFVSCANLTSIPLFDTSSVTNFANVFNSCASLTSIPLFDTSSGTDFSRMVYGCTNLTCLDGIDTRAKTNTTDMFTNTPALLRPNATEQTAILAGALWTNDTPC